MMTLAVPLQAACSAPVLSGMVAQVCLGKVGPVAAREVSRFARNSRHWQQLIETCRVVDIGLFRAHPRDSVTARGTGLAVKFVHALAAVCRARR